METILLKRFDGNYTLENWYGRFDGNYTLENLYGQFDGNYTFDQIDVNCTLENLYGQFYVKKGARLVKFVVLNNVGGAARYVWKRLWRTSESCIKRGANTTRSSQYKPMEQPFGATSANERSV